MTLVKIKDKTNKEEVYSSYRDAIRGKEGWKRVKAVQEWLKMNA